MACRTGRIDLALGGRSIAEVRALAAFAESRGLEGAWISEVNGMDMVSQAAAAGLATSRIRIGTAIVPFQTRDPLLMAMTAASLADLTDGRFVLGLGTSTRVIIEDWHGRPWDRPLAATREFVDLYRRLLAGERVSANAGSYRLNRSSVSIRDPRPVPLYLAALNERMLRLAGEIADGVILNFVSPAAARSAAAIAREAHRAAGRTGDFEVMVYFRSSVNVEDAQVRVRYQQELLTYLLSPVYQQMFGREGYGALCEETVRRWARGARDEALASIPMTFLKERTLIGTPDELHARLRLYFEAGVDTALVLPVPVPGSDYLSSCMRMLSEITADPVPA